MIPAIGNKKIYTVQDKNFGYAVLNTDGTEVVPFGKYSWIDGFDKGLARVRIGNVTNGQNENGNKWGLIDENGREILPLEYDCIWTFYGKKRVTTKVVKGNVAHNVILSELFDEDKLQEKGCHSNNYDANADE